MSPSAAVWYIIVPMGHFREVRMDDGYDCSDYSRFQMNYLDIKQRRPFPNTRVFIGERLVVQTNSLSCFGTEPDLSRPLVGFFGDSVVQGVSTGSFVNHIELPGCSVINGGVEGCFLDHVVDNFAALQERAPMVCAAIHSGWHNLTYGETTDAFWEKQFARVSGVPVIAHFRLTADINSEAVERGYEALFGANYHSNVFTQDRPSVAEFKAAVDQKNRLIEQMCKSKGRVLIDLDAVLLPKTYADVTAKYFDIIHPRPETYPEVGLAISEQLAPHVARALESWSGPGAQAAMPAMASADGDRGRVYPLW